MSDGILNEKFIQGEIIEKPQKPNIIKWGDSKKIILVLILFAYFNNLTSEFYNIFYNMLKVIILLVIIQVIFKESNVYKIFYNNGNKLINYISSFLK